jgi:hypothetical protein
MRRLSTIKLSLAAAVVATAAVALPTATLAAWTFPR